MPMSVYIYWPGGTFGRGVTDHSLPLWNLPLLQPWNKNRPQSSPCEVHLCKYTPPTYPPTTPNCSVLIDNIWCKGSNCSLSLIRSILGNLVTHSLIRVMQIIFESYHLPLTDHNDQSINGKIDKAAPALFGWKHFFRWWKRSGPAQNTMY